MPLRWEVSHADKLVLAVGTGDATLKDVEAYLDDLVTRGAMPYAKIFDASEMIPKHDDHDMMMLAARMSAYTGMLKGGPLALVSTSKPVRETIDRYINLSSNTERPIAVFKTAAEGRAWIDSLRAG